MDILESFEFTPGDILSQIKKAKKHFHTTQGILPLFITLNTECFDFILDMLEEFSPNTLYDLLSEEEYTSLCELYINIDENVDDLDFVLSEKRIEIKSHDSVVCMLSTPLLKKLNLPLPCLN